MHGTNQCQCVRLLRIYQSLFGWFSSCSRKNLPVRSGFFWKIFTSLLIISYSGSSQWCFLLKRMELELTTDLNLLWRSTWKDWYMSFLIWVIRDYPNQSILDIAVFFDKEKKFQIIVNSKNEIIWIFFDISNHSYSSNGLYYISFFILK